MFNLISRIYETRIAPLKRGGTELKATKKRAWIGFALFCGLLAFLEILYLVSPSPVNFVIENAPISLLFSILSIGLLSVGYPLFQSYNTYYELGPNHLVEVHGVLISMRRREHLIPYELINGYRIKQNIFGRIFNFGTLSIGTAMTGEVQCRLRDIEDPQKAMKLLDDKREQIRDFTYVDFSKIENSH